jgi:LysM repeat protein
MMHKILWLFILILSFVYAKKIIDCRVVISGVSECNPYGEKYLYAKDIREPSKAVKKEKKLTTLKSKEELQSYIRALEAYASKIEEKASRKRVLKSKEELSKYIQDLEDYLKESKSAEKTVGIYRVRAGDALSRISRKFNVPIHRLRSLNNLKKGSVLRIGQKLTIPLPQKKIDELKAVTLKDLEKRYAKYINRRLRVTATAYTSSPKETDDTPFLAAWNNRLVPGMKSIAVSRDLLSVYGMRNGMKVRISGLPGVYRVLDKMNKRYRKRIDIYMGLDRPKALRWGKRSVIIHW